MWRTFVTRKGRRLRGLPLTNYGDIDEQFESSWNFDNHSAAGNDAFIANIVRHLNSTPFNFGAPSSADITFFENQESVDIESLIEEVIAEMDAADDSTATSPSEE